MISWVRDSLHIMDPFFNVAPTLNVQRFHGLHTNYCGYSVSILILLPIKPNGYLCFW